MNKVIKYIIGAKDATGAAISSALNRIKSFAASVGRNLANIQAGFQMLGRAAQSAYSVLQRAFRFETLTVQFKTLVGSMDEARDHMQMLQKLGETPPFSLEAFAAASRTLLVMTDNALGFEESLKLVGDAAAATGTPIESLAHEVGRAFAIIRDGQPITRATMALRNMGVITPEVAAKLDELQKSGATNIEVWRVLEDELKKYNGAMAETEQTGQGLMDAISSQWDKSVRTFGEAFLTAAKDGMGSLLEYMKRINEDGTLEEWAARLADSLMDAITSMREFMETTSELKAGIWEKSGFSDLYHGPASVLAGLSAAVTAKVNGMSWGESFGKIYDEASLEEMNKGYYTHQMMKSGMIVSGNDEKMAKRIAEYTEEVKAKREEKYAKIREEAAKRRAERQAREEAEAKEKAAQKAAAVEEKMAEAQAKQDEKREQEAAQSYAEEYTKWWDKQQEEEAKAREEAAKAREEAARQEEAERLRIEQNIQRQRLRYLQEELSERQQEESNAQKRLAQAEANSRQAWGWYRNRDSWKAQLEEERANAEAEKRFEKEAYSLTHSTGWRSRKLNDDQEIVRRVVLAREEENNAREYARKTAEATAEAAEYLEMISSAISEGGDY